MTDQEENSEEESDDIIQTYDLLSTVQKYQGVVSILAAVLTILMVGVIYPSITLTHVGYAAVLYFTVLVLLGVIAVSLDLAIYILQTIREES